MVSSAYASIRDGALATKTGLNQNWWSMTTDPGINLDRTDTTIDLSQKAEKVTCCRALLANLYSLSRPVIFMGSVWMDDEQQTIE
jgi:hypothetical protein